MDIWKQYTKPRLNEKYDLSIFLHGKKLQVLKHLEADLKVKKGITWFISVQVKMIKYRPDGKDDTATPHFRSSCQRLMNLNALDEQYHESVEKIKDSFQAYQRKGSGWQLM